MSAISLKGNAGGTGTLSIAAPSTNTNQTLTLPDQTGTLLTGAGAIGVNASAPTSSLNLDASGNVGIGTTSPGTKLQVGDGTAAVQSLTVGTSSGSGGGAYTAVKNGSTYIAMLGNYSAVLGGAYSASPVMYFTGGLQFSEAGSERMRIDTSGNLLVGATSQFNAGKQCIAFSGTAYYGLSLKDTVDQTNARFIGFINGSGTVIGSVDRVTTTNAVVYNTTSDYRLKTVTGTVTGQGERIDALKPIDYLWTEGGQQARGFLAHEFQEVYSNSVTGEKDAVDADGNPKYQAMQAGSSEVIADLVAEIQSLRKRLTALEAGA